VPFLHLKIHGRVQGVSFRYCTQRQAEALGLTGWVRNCHDGTVETLIVGPADTLASMRRWLERGPTLARVERVELQAEGEQLPECYTGFEVCRDL